jgi:hypothetical protein
MDPPPPPPLYPKIVGLKRLRGSWTPQDVLSVVVLGGYRALIDTAALITGFSNKEAARYVLHHKTPSGGEGYDVAVFLDEQNHQVFITKQNDANPKPIKQCGVPLERRFTFYDQVVAASRVVGRGSNSACMMYAAKA